MKRNLVTVMGVSDHNTKQKLTHQQKPVKSSGVITVCSHIIATKTTRKAKQKACREAIPLAVTLRSADVLTVSSHTIATKVMTICKSFIPTNAVCSDSILVHSISFQFCQYTVQRTISESPALKQAGPSLSIYTLHE